jgi:hypothetical protein
LGEKRQAEETGFCRKNPVSGEGRAHARETGFFRQNPVSELSVSRTWLLQRAENNQLSQTINPF